MEPSKEVPKPWVETDAMPKPKTRTMRNTVIEVKIMWIRHHNCPLERRYRPDKRAIGRVKRTAMQAKVAGFFEVYYWGFFFFTIGKYKRTMSDSVLIVKIQHAVTEAGSERRLVAGLLSIITVNK